MLALLRGAYLRFVQRIEIILLVFGIGFARIHLCIELLQAVQTFRGLRVDVAVLRAGSQQYRQRNGGQSDQQCRGSVLFECDASDFARPGRFSKGAKPQGSMRLTTILWQTIEQSNRGLRRRFVVTASQLVVLAQEAHQDLMRWSSFVAQTEFIWQHPMVVSDADGWQSIWFEMEILNGLALAEWEDQGAPRDWSYRWSEAYEQEAQSLVSELLPLLIKPEPPV
ncbi:hypothetical protein SBH91_002136 [Pseudomonas putida]